MGVSALTPPATSREPKYKYGESDVSDALALLDSGQHPGDGPFGTSGKARSAANALTTAIKAQTGRDGFGARVWQDGKEFYFVLKTTRRAYHGRKSSGKGSGKK